MNEENEKEQEKYYNKMTNRICQIYREEVDENNQQAFFLGSLNAIMILHKLLNKEERYKLRSFIFQIFDFGEEIEVEEKTNEEN